LQGIDRSINSYYDAPAFLKGAARMRGHDDQAAHLFSYVSPEQRVPADHPLRAIRQMTDRVLATLSPKFTRMYSTIGRPSIAPEKLLRTLLLQALYTIRSERLLMEQLEYNLLFRWFVGLNIDDPVWDPTVFSKNRDRLLSADVAALFFRAVLDEAKARGLVSDEHFTVDGTLLEAWASLKSFKKVGDEDPPPPPDDPGNPTVNFHGETRSNLTHASTTDPDAKLARKGRGKEAKLSYTGNVLMENRNGLAVDVLVNLATGTAERDAAFAMAAEIPGDRRVTIGGDKNYDTAALIDDWRHLNVTPHVAQNDKRRCSAIDKRTTRHPGYQISQQKRKRVEEIFGWLKTVGGLRKLRHRGLERVAWMFTFAVAAYNLVRLRNLAATG
jgi:transposase